MTDLSRSVSLGLRSVQSIFAFIGMATSGGGFPQRQAGQFDIQLGSPEFSFLLLTSFSAWMFTVTWLISVHGLKVPEPRPIITMTLDGLFTLFFFSGGIAAAISDYVKHCDAYGEGLRCGVLKTSVAFAFLTFMLFCTSLVIALIVNSGIPLSFSRGGPSNNIPFFGDTQSPTDAMASANYNESITPVVMYPPATNIANTPTGSNSSAPIVTQQQRNTQSMVTAV